MRFFEFDPSLGGYVLEGTDRKTGVNDLIQWLEEWKLNSGSGDAGNGVGGRDRTMI